MGRIVAKAIARKSKRDVGDVPTWAYRLGLAVSVFALGGLCLWFLSRLISDFDGFGRELRDMRQDQMVIKSDIGSVRKDVERVEKKQDQQAEKFERFERDYRRDQKSFDDKLDRKIDKK